MALSEEYIDLTFFKSMIRSTDTQDDVQYQQFVTDANRKVSAAIFRYVDLLLDDASDDFESAKNAALAFARHLLSIDIELIEKSKTYLSFYNVQLYGEDGTESDPKAGGLIQKLIGTRTTRTKTVLVTVDPRDNKVPLPTQNDIFVFDDFA